MTVHVGVGIEWDAAFVQAAVAEWTISRGASPELTAGSQPGSATIRLINTSNDYNPENAGGPLFGFLQDGPRVWVGVNADGTVTYDVLKTVYGLFAGRITDLSVIPGEGTSVPPFTEIVCADPLEWASRQDVTLPDSRTRSQAELRLAVLNAIGFTTTTLPVEPTTLPLSSANGKALNILDAINDANGTRHFAKPEDTPAGWFRYVAVRRTSGLDGTSSATLSVASQHVTSTDGWRISADGVINQQKATVEPVDFPARVEVWTQDALPLVIATGSPLVIFADFGDYVDSAEVDYTSTGSALTVTVVPFGTTAKLTLTSTGTSTVTSLRMFGFRVFRGSVVSVVIDDTVSQATARGVRAGTELTGEYLGTISSAKGFAQHIVWRFANNLYRPTITVANWLPQMFDLDLFDRIALTSPQLGISGRIFEIVGLTLHCEIAALNGSTPVVHHTATYVLQESRVQTTTQWFTLDTSTSDGPDFLAY